MRLIIRKGANHVIFEIGYDNYGNKKKLNLKKKVLQVLKFILCILLIILSFNCSSLSKEDNDDLPDDIEIEEDIKLCDIYESLNRSIFDFNVGFEKLFIKPTTKVYATVTFTSWGRKRITNLLQNLYEPNHMINSIFYGKPADFFTSALRFLLNSTIGIGGLFDVSTKLGIKKVDLSFRDVMAEKMCIENGTYVVLPILGSSNARNSVALGIDKIILDPFSYILPIYGSVIRFGLEVTALSYENRDLINQVMHDSIDSYATVRSLYYQSNYSKEFNDCCGKK